MWFEDEARFGQKGTLTTVWADRGTRPTAPKQTAYANLHVLTAVCPATGRAEGLVSQRLNAGVVQAFLDQFAATIPAGVHAVLVWDGAGYHSACRAVRPPPNVTLVTLAAVLAGTHPGRAAVAVPAPAPLVEPGVQGHRRGRGGRRRRVAGRLPDPGPGQDRLPVRVPTRRQLTSGKRIIRVLAEAPGPDAMDARVGMREYEERRT